MLGFREAAQVDEHSSQLLARSQRTRVVRSERVRAALECPSVEGLGLRVMSERLVEVPETIHSVERRRMADAIDLCFEREGLAHEDPGFLVPSEQRQIVGEVVHLAEG